MQSFRVAILTASDKGARGERQDESGLVIREMVEAAGGRVAIYEVVPDEFTVLRDKLLSYTDEPQLHLVLTTGGTGLSPRDNTPDATLAVIEKQVPGMAEAMRAFGLQKTPHAMLSRAVCGIRNGTLIVNLPGSPRAVRENLGVVLPAIPHALDVLCGQSGECANLRNNDA
ncbi:MAG: MogA/MoaB family molybdenum cofactor biosynthesis protein [Dethiobacter sp.]|nr:MogA/MoaB family molybdenum cofactor biosynthesis protein [Dethiobacter sp.]MBS3900734.1 MogA/MoaB family molybdenum cofactor biosynthesis protein [Dethiobacter sp.]MBS3989284.1 MogA/MoaB family molybdenum cofactor biosynthesis protein [Dethiobacter sp.]